MKRTIINRYGITEIFESKFDKGDNVVVSGKVSATARRVFGDKAIINSVRYSTTKKEFYYHLAGLRGIEIAGGVWESDLSKFCSLNRKTEANE